MVINDRPPGRRVISQPDVDEIGSTWTSVLNNTGSWLYERLTVPTAQCYFNLHSISLVKLLSISVRIAGTLLLLFRSHMHMNILKEIIYVAHDNVYSLFEFLSKPRALDTRDKQIKTSTEQPLVRL